MVWIRRHGPLQLTDEFLVATESQLGLDPCIDGQPGERLQEECLGAVEVLVGKLGEGPASSMGETDLAPPAFATNLARDLIRDQIATRSRQPSRTI
jgi:hypothetical protein